MGLKLKRKESRKIISGKGYCPCRNREYVSGKGFIDNIKILSDIKENPVKPITEVIGNAVRIADSTKTIVQEIRNKRKPELQNIVDRINQFKIGSGFAYV
jgi:hypothetical protein